MSSNVPASSAEEPRRDPSADRQPGEAVSTSLTRADIEKAIETIEIRYAKQSVNNRGPWRKWAVSGQVSANEFELLMADMAESRPVRVVFQGRDARRQPVTLRGAAFVTSLRQDSTGTVDASFVGTGPLHGYLRARRKAGKA